MCADLRWMFLIRSCALGTRIICPPMAVCTPGTRVVPHALLCGIIRVPLSTKTQYGGAVFHLENACCSRPCQCPAQLPRSTCHTSIFCMVRTLFLLLVILATSYIPYSSYGTNPLVLTDRSCLLPVCDSTAELLHRVLLYQITGTAVGGYSCGQRYGGARCVYGFCGYCSTAVLALGVIKYDMIQSTSSKAIQQQ